MTRTDHGTGALRAAPLGTRDKHTGKVCVLMSEVEGIGRFSNSVLEESYEENNRKNRESLTAISRKWGNG